ncbi:MAG: signal recognition particle-docking protein FtsY [Myxococcales bacterium]|nr:signal recognition particle-docking protein FtsY [Myxococcales bacterium]
MQQTYIVYVVLAVIFAVALLLIWRLSKRRRDLQPPAEEQRPKLEIVPPAVDQQAPKPAVEAGKGLKEGLEKTRGGFVARISGLIGKKQIDQAMVDQLEEILFTADIGAKTSQRLFEAVKASLSRNELKDADAVWAVIRQQSEAILERAQEKAGALDVGRAHPFVILVIGVNGVGKTTTIGKLASKFAADGKKVILAAGDTFRAAATEQLEIWGQRTNTPVVKGREGGDPSAVLFDAVKRAQTEDYDVVICDTAGRLHTKDNLMAELEKVRRVMKKAMSDAPHETILVLDATNGQNAIAQAATFKQAMDITGIVLTKLDGTAKGGVILGICDELGVPVRFVGIGEKVADLRPFDAHEFVQALYDEA